MSKNCIWVFFVGQIEMQDIIMTLSESHGLFAKKCKLLVPKSLVYINQYVSYVLYSYFCLLIACNRINLAHITNLAHVIFTIIQNQHHFANENEI